MAYNIIISQVQYDAVNRHIRAIAHYQHVDGETVTDIEGTDSQVKIPINIVQAAVAGAANDAERMTAFNNLVLSLREQQGRFTDEKLDELTQAKQQGDVIQAAIDRIFTFPHSIEVPEE